MEEGLGPGRAPPAEAWGGQRLPPGPGEASGGGREGPGGGPAVRGEAPPPRPAAASRGSFGVFLGGCPVVRPLRGTGPGCQWDRGCMGGGAQGLGVSQGLGGVTGLWGHSHCTQIP